MKRFSCKSFHHRSFPRFSSTLWQYRVIYSELFERISDPTPLVMGALSMKNSIKFPKGSSLGDLNAISRFSLFGSLVEMFIFRYLITHANTHSNVVHALCSVIGRIVKVSYLTDLRQRKLLSDMGEFFSGGLFCQRLGFEILTEVVVQISHFTPCTVLCSLSS